MPSATMSLQVEGSLKRALKAWANGTGQTVNATLERMITAHLARGAVELQEMIKQTTSEMQTWAAVVGLLAKKPSGASAMDLDIPAKHPAAGLLGGLRAQLKWDKSLKVTLADAKAELALASRYRQHLKTCAKELTSALPGDAVLVNGDGRLKAEVVDRIREIVHPMIRGEDKLTEVISEVAGQIGYAGQLGRCYEVLSGRAKISKKSRRFLAAWLAERATTNVIPLRPQRDI
jgi:hypothetical protein